MFVFPNLFIVSSIHNKYMNCNHYIVKMWPVKRFEFVIFASLMVPNVTCCSLHTKVPFGSPRQIRGYAWGQPADISDNVSSYYLLPDTKSPLRLCKAELISLWQAQDFALLQFMWAHTFYLSDIPRWPVHEPTAGLILTAGFQCVCSCVGTSMSVHIRVCVHDE